MRQGNLRKLIYDYPSGPEFSSGLEKFLPNKTLTLNNVSLDVKLHNPYDQVPISVLVYEKGTELDPFQGHGNRTHIQFEIPDYRKEYTIIVII